MTKPSEKPKNYCKICTKTIAGNSYKFKAHLFSHNATKPRHKCEFCSKQFFRLDAYTTHINSHLGKPKMKYICDYCDRAFVSKINLIAHLKKIHDDGLDSNHDKYVCNICDVTYCEQRLLDHHIRRLHFNVDSYKEPLYINRQVNESWIEKVGNGNACVRMTKVNDNLIMIKSLKMEYEIAEEVKTVPSDYMFTLTDQYAKVICDYCQKQMLKKSLRSHIREVHMDLRRHTCAECKFSFARRYQLVNHKCGKARRCKKKKVVLSKEV